MLEMEDCSINTQELKRRGVDILRYMGFIDNERKKLLICLKRDMHERYNIAIRINQLNLLRSIWNNSIKDYDEFSKEVYYSWKIFIGEEECGDVSSVPLDGTKSTK